MRTKKFSRRFRGVVLATLAIAAIGFALWHYPVPIAISLTLTTAPMVHGCFAHMEKEVLRDLGTIAGLAIAVIAGLVLLFVLHWLFSGLALLGAVVAFEMQTYATREEVLYAVRGGWKSQREIRDVIARSHKVTGRTASFMGGGFLSFHLVQLVRARRILVNTPSIDPYSGVRGYVPTKAYRRLRNGSERSLPEVEVTTPRTGDPGA